MPQRRYARSSLRTYFGERRVVRLGGVREESLEVATDDAMENRLFWFSRAIRRRELGHARPCARVVPSGSVDNRTFEDWHDRRGPAVGPPGRAFQTDVIQRRDDGPRRGSYIREPSVRRVDTGPKRWRLLAIACRSLQCGCQLAQWPVVAKSD